MSITVERRTESVPQQTADAAALRKGWADFLNDFEWDWFGSLTFKEPQSPEGAARRFAGWVRRLEQRSRGAVHWFHVIEATTRDFAHIHCLATTRRPISVADIRTAWAGDGYADIVRYDPQRGARYYLVKAAGTSRFLDWDVSRNLRRRVPDQLLSQGE